MKIKKLIGIMVAAAFILCIGMKNANALPTPRLHSDGGSPLIYNATTDILYTASDTLKMTYTPGNDEVVKPDSNGEQGTYFAVKIDDTGTLDPTWQPNAAWETSVGIATGTFEVGGTYYNDVKYGLLTDPDPDLDGVLLYGNVLAGFIAIPSSGPPVPDVLTFTVDPYGGLVPGASLPYGAVWPADSPKFSVVALMDGHMTSGTFADWIMIGNWR